MRSATVLILLAICQLTACDRKPPETRTEVTSAPVTDSVTFEFVLGEETKVATVKDVADGSTLESVLRQVSDPVISLSGSGTTAFVNKIGDTATGSTEGWTFTIDGQWINKGVGSVDLHPPTTVRWEFGAFRL